MAGFLTGLGAGAGDILRARAAQRQAQEREDQIQALARERSMRAALFDQQMRQAQRKRALIDSLPPEVQQAYALDPAIASKMFVQRQQAPGLAKLAGAISDPETKAEVQALIDGGATPADVIKLLQNKERDRIEFLTQKNQMLGLKANLQTTQLRDEVANLHEGMENLRISTQLERQKRQLEKQMDELKAAQRQTKDAQTIATIKGQLAEARELYGILKARSGASGDAAKQRETLLKDLGQLSTKMAAAKRSGVAVDPAMEQDLNQIRAALGIGPTATDAGTSASPAVPGTEAPPPSSGIPTLTADQRAAIQKMAPGNVYVMPDGTGLFKDADGKLKVL